MQLFVTTKGIARALKSGADELEIVDRTAHDLKTFLATNGLERLRQMTPLETIKMSEAHFLPPIATPSRFVIVGLNYRAHSDEVGKGVPEHPIFFDVPGTAAHGAGHLVKIPASAPDRVDYEGEIGFVIGKRAECIAADDAWSVVAGITPVNDVSARDVQAGGTLEALSQAKGFPTFKPFGPCLACLDEFDDLLDISIRTWVNGELRQEARSSDMVFSLPEIIEAVSAHTVLEPGDVICTGSPSGVAQGGAFPFLKHGDKVEIEIEGLPRLLNEFTSER